MFCRVIRPVFAVLLAAVSVAGAAAAPRLAPARPATDVGGTVVPGTVWTRAGSPYVTTANVQVPAGITLTIEPGVVVKMGAYHNLDVAGALQAVGTDADPIQFEPASTEAWGAIQLRAGSGPSEIAHAVLTGGGANQREMLGIATDAAVVHDSKITDSKGMGVEIKNGASPTLRDCFLYKTTVGSANPPAALHILGPSAAVITGNFFQSNHEAVAWEADATPTFTGNRFDLNGYNGVRVGGRISRAVELHSLGPRAWSYWITGTGLDIVAGGTLTIGPGTTLRFANGTSLRVRGTLRVLGTAGAKVLFSDERQHQPGQWREIRFEDESIDYDPATGAGSIIEHAEIEYGGASQTGAVFILNSAPRIANTAVRDSRYQGIGVRGAAARPQLIGLDIDSNTSTDLGVGLDISEGAAPTLSFSRVRGNFIGVRAAGIGDARVGPHVSFESNATYSVSNTDDQHCLDASGNAWGAPSGPLDQSTAPDVCGQADHLGDGELVSDNVRYEPFEGQLQAPFLDRPRCGTIADASPELGGFAPRDAQAVAVYDNQVEIGRATVAPVPDGPPRFAFTPPPLAPGSHVLQAQSVAGDAASGLSQALNLMVDPTAQVDPATLTMSYDLDGNHYVQPYLNEDGCVTLRDDNGWAARPLVGAPITLAARITCAGGATPAASIAYLGVDHPMTTAPDGRYQATFDPAGGGPFAVRVECPGTTATLNLGTINPSVQGFVHDAVGGVLSRIGGARVTLLVEVPGTTDFVRWDGAGYFGQTNPLTTGPAGWYAFYPQPGTYKVQVDAAGYHPYVSPERTVVVEPILSPIALQPLIAGRCYLPALPRGGE